MRKEAGKSISNKKRDQEQRLGSVRCKHGRREERGSVIGQLFTGNADLLQSKCNAL